MSANYEWKTLITTDIYEHSIKRLDRTETRDHPLKNVVVTERIPRRILGSQPSTGRTTPTTSTPSIMLEPLTNALEGLDPLTAFAIQEMDPLSKMATEVTDFPKTKTDIRKPEISWQSRKAAILSKFTTSEKISIITSFLSEGEKVVVKAQSTAVDKIQHRLEQLDYFEEGSQRKLDLSQSEYVGRIEQLNKELVSAWNSEQRVKALKIAIQCAKLLADTDVLRFYPSKFVLITDILDNFGQLVYHRLRTKADYFKPGSKVPTALPEDFRPEMVPDTARETCLNWFYKIASIRELVPRLYVEIALLRCYNFLSFTDCPDALLRLTQVINGVGNPLVAVYARCYLCRIGVSVTSNRLFLIDNFNGFLDCYHHLFSRAIKADLLKQKVPQSVYMTLFTPALDFILESVAQSSDSSENLLNSLLEKCRNQGNSSLILNTIMSAFKPNCIADRTMQFLEMIGQSLDQGIPLYLLMRTLGLCVSLSPPPMEQSRQILNIAWRYIGSLGQTEEYVSSAEAWVPYVVQNFSCKEVNVILGDVIAHLSPDRSYELYYPQLKFMVEKIVSHIQDFEALLAMDNFLPFVDLFQQESIKVDVCKRILSQNTENHSKISDAVVINSLLFLCNVLHDSVNALTPDDEYRQIGDILCYVVRMVDYGRDFEQQLGFYVEARGMFSNIDVVLAQLVQCVNCLSVNTRLIVKGLHTRKTADFVRACAAYCFITIPSIKSVKTRLELYLLSGQIALFNHCLGQADACFKAALNIITEIQEEKYKNCELFLVSYVKQFLSLLLVVPDNPDCSVLNLIRILLNILRNFDWESRGSLICIYLNVIDMLSVMAQEDFPYHVDRVESNDSLYGSDPKFLAEINKMCSLIIGEILSQLKQIGPSRQQSYLAMELFNRIVIRSNLNATLMNLALNLWNLGAKSDFANVKYLTQFKKYLKQKSVSRPFLMDLIEKLNIPV